jgi:transcriptional antiterminator Rof (Rho-off)
MSNTDCWQKIVAEIFTISASLGGLLKSAKLVDFSDGVLKLEVYYKFHKEKIEEMKNREVLENVAEKVFQNKIKLECLLAEAPAKSELTDIKNQNIISVAEQMFS